MDGFFDSKTKDLVQEEDSVFSNFDINHLFGKEKLEDIQEKISKATGLAFVTVDYKGEPVTELTSFTSFCREIRQNEGEKRLCWSSDAFGAIQAAVTQKTSVYFCPCGLLEVAIPIIVRGHYLGGFIGGQIRCLDAPQNICRLETVMHHAEDYKVSKSDLFNEILEMKYQQFVNIADLISMIINQLGEKELSGLMQKESLNKAMDSLNEKKKRMELEYSLKNAELVALQSQMNPSFLFRCLNSISNLAVIENAPKTNEMTTMFAEFLRYNLTNTKNSISIPEEMENIERYLKIQKVRLGDRLNYSITIADNIHMQRIPCFIVLPFIEKAVFYGIDQKREGGTVRVSVYYQDNDVVICVEDNGLGLSEEKISRKFKPYKEGGYEGDAIETGISNIRQRLVNSFGPKYDVVMENSESSGTKCLIKYPKNYDEKVL